ncbi:MAG: type I polyketide synthase [Candidatus Eremiobacteraeota bacterium]|nr:type I polyketide synthase [Candidatus Eremiobacteraeota bacterium]MCW5870388.1 type I polyketide synthase [Candidatus Eremiobacteraeota bacterium]
MKFTPIAITGIGCRLPGEVDSAQALWKLLMEGVDAVTDIPSDRWLKDRFHHPEKGRDFRTPQAQGGFLKDIDGFDPAFFGISPREASSLDPQQRILLEVAWEALEDAGYPLEKVAGTRMGVFTGASSHDYYDIQDLDSLTTHSVTGWAMCMTSNRISYAFDLQGPSLTIDTACSSALVALHAAVTNMQQGECDSALVCAVNAMLHPIHHVAFSRLSMLSPSSRCHAFDVCGDGYVRSEGAGVVVLKPLEKALADGDHIYATILRTVVNSDGRNEGLTFPSVEGQIRLLRDSYAGLPVEKVRYLEAHGTGTQAGDPVETTAIGSVLGHPSRKLKIGSVKTNIGHLEAGAGMAGLIKTCLVASHRRIPANLHFDNPNPGVPLEKFGLEIPTSITDLPAEEFLLGVNSFGFGGTNGHVVLSSPPATSESEICCEGPQLICLSARSEGALKELISRYQTLDKPLRQVAFSSLTRRSHHPHRLALAADQLSDLETASIPPAARQAPKIAFVYSGQGSQWLGMGRNLLQDATFSAFVDECEPHFQKHAGWSLREAFQSDSTSIDQTAVVQPMIFALQAGLTRMLEAWGVVPEALIGHSVGEVASAWASGALELADAIQLVVNRGRSMDRESSKGRMISVSASVGELELYLQPGVCVAALNAPNTVVLSGEHAAMEQVGQRLRHAGFDCHDVKVEYAFHSAQLDVIEGDLRAALQDLKPRRPHRKLYSTVSGDPVQTVDVDYWWQNVRSTVRFSPAIANAARDGITLFLEIGGHPVLGAAISEIGGKAVATLRRHQPERKAFLQSLAELYMQGQNLQWGEEACDWTALPHYPWQRERYWQEARRVRRFRTEPGHYALLGHQADPNIFSQFINGQDPGWLKDHIFHSQTILSASSMMEMGFEATHARNAGGLGGRREAPPNDQDGQLPLALDNVHIDTACFVNHQLQLQTVVSEDGNLTVYSEAVDGSEPRQVHFRAHICSDPGAIPADLDWQAIEARLPEAWQGSLSQQWARRGLIFGPTFDCIQSGRRGPGEALAHVQGAARLPAADGLSFTHPGTIDSCFQVGLAALDSALMGEGTNWLPVAARRVRVLRPLEEDLIAYMRCTHQTARELEGDLTVCNRQGEVLFDLLGYRLVRAAEAASNATDGLCYGFHWVPAELPKSEPAPGKWLVFSDGSSLSSRLIARFDNPHVIQPGQNFDMREVGPLAGVLHLQGLSACLEDPAAPLMPLLEMVQQNDRHGLTSSRLFCVTRRAQPAHPDIPVDPNGSPVWGLVRVLATEDPFLKATLIDIQDDSDEERIFQELSSKTPEEVAYRHGERLIQRLQRLPLSQQESTPVKPRPDQDYVLTCERPGTLEALHWTVPAPRPLKPHEVRVQVAAAGLNFSDVMRAMGLYPTEGVLGIEMAGTVSEIGSEVSDLEPGQRVFGIAPSAFASQVVLPRDFLVPTPAQLSDLQAAAMPLVFVTAYYALLEVGRLKAKDTLLVHAASGGLGLAAIQLARKVGARVLATAGSPEKVHYLHEMGVEHVFNSRSTSFVDDVLRVTHGEGVDVVLNSLAGEGLTGGLSILRRFGRFLDVTKRDIYNDLRVGLSPFRKGLTYSAIDLEQVINFEPETVQHWMLQLKADLESGAMQPLPLQTFSYNQAIDAFRCLSMARHIGKVVLQAETPEKVQPSWRPSPQGTYIVTGGMGGFGREVVLWLLKHGAGRVAVLSRTPQAHSGFDDARVEAHAVDVGDARAVAELFEKLGEVRGIVHAAMALDDVPTLSLTRERLEGVFHAKIHGSWNLHQASLQQPLDFFILFSSNAAWFGAAGQGNYAASNAYLDSLAHYRKSQGLPALTVNWGPIGDVGYLARNPMVAAWLESGGSKMITSAEAMQAMESALRVNPTQVGVMNADWALLLKAMGGKPVPRFEPLLAGSGGTESGPQNLENLDPEERRTALQPMLMAQLARVLGTQPQKIDASQSLSDMGLDSLMSLQLRNWVKSTLNVTLSASALLDQPSVDSLVGWLADSMQPQPEAVPPDQALDHLEDDEIEAMLGAMLMNSPE